MPLLRKALYSLACIFCSLFVAHASDLKKAAPSVVNDLHVPTSKERRDAASQKNAPMPSAKVSPVERLESSGDVRDGNMFSESFSSSKGKASSTLSGSRPSVLDEVNTTNLDGSIPAATGDLRHNRADIAKFPASSPLWVVYLGLVGLPALFGLLVWFIWPLAGRWFGFEENSELADVERLANRREPFISGKI